MTFVQKYLLTPAVGAAGLFAGYVAYRRKFPAAPAAPKPSDTGSSADLERLAAAIDQLTTRVAAVEEKGMPQHWLAALDSKFSALENRVTSQSQRISAVESSYGNISARLDAILKSLDRRQPEPAVPTAA